LILAPNETGIGGTSETIALGTDIESHKAGGSTFDGRINGNERE
jgi:hypothetical protein